MKKQLIICNCHSVDHQVIFTSHEPGDEDVIVSVHLSPHKFWKRLKLGINYILGKYSVYGHFEEVLTDKAEIKKIAENL